MDLAKRQIMSNPNMWPQWPYFPVKRKNANNQQEDLGFLHASTRTTVYFGNIFFLRDKELADFRNIGYVSFEAMFADGWVGD